MINRIKKLRSATGLSQSKFAAIFNIPVKTIQSWESESRKPPDYVIDMMEKILDYKRKEERISRQDNTTDQDFD